jgi:hypothetical protein
MATDGLERRCAKYPDWLVGKLGGESGAVFDGRRRGGRGRDTDGARGDPGGSVVGQHQKDSAPEDQVGLTIAGSCVCEGSDRFLVSPPKETQTGQAEETGPHLAKAEVIGY